MRELDDKGERERERERVKKEGEMRELDGMMIRGKIFKASSCSETTTDRIRLSFWSTETETGRTLIHEMTRK